MSLISYVFRQFMKTSMKIKTPEMQHHITETKKAHENMLINTEVKSGVFGAPLLKQTNFLLKFPKLLTVNKASPLALELIFGVSVHCYNLVAVVRANIPQKYCSDKVA